VVTPAEHALNTEAHAYCFIKIILATAIYIISAKVLGSVSDPHSLSPDPDPAFLAEYRSGIPKSGQNVETYLKFSNCI
jgi:hypothetical protein